MSIFDQIKKVNEFGQEYWSARDLYKTLEYTEYGKFLPTISKAKTSCINSGQEASLHFADVSEPQKSRNQYGEINGQKIDDIYLSRYACYLIAMEADGRKPTVALAKTAKEVGVFNYANFVDYGYLGLYRMRNKDILVKKKLKPKDSLMDNIGSEELAANLFRATQAEAKIKREGIQGQDKASMTHYEVGKEVRETIKKMGGTMPESLPKSDNIKDAKKRIKQQEKLSKQK